MPGRVFRRAKKAAVSLSAEQASLLFDHMKGLEVVRARRQTRIRRNTVDVDDESVRHYANPLQEIKWRRSQMLQRLLQSFL